MKKNIKGFTLVELIVVIAIIGVLAAILVPAMMGWIAKANLSTANAGAKEIYQTGQAIYMELEGTGYEIGGDKTTWKGARVWSNDELEIGEEIDDTFQNAMIRKFADAKNSYWGIAFDYEGDGNVLIGTARAAVFSKGGYDSKNYIGTYPIVDDNGKGKWNGSPDDAFTLAMDDADDIFKASMNTES